MLLITNMFLSRKCVSSSPICPNGTDNCQVSLGDLFDRAVKLSHYIHSLSAEMFNEFVSTERLSQKVPFDRFVFQFKDYIRRCKF